MLNKLLLVSAFVLLFGAAAVAQTSLTLSSTSATAGSSVALNLSLASPPGSEPAALQWTLDYPPASVASLLVTVGPATTAAQKSISCAGGVTAYICIASGLNANTIANGVVALVSVVLTAGATTAPIGVSNTLGASSAGAALAVSPIGGTVTVPALTASPLTITTLSCSPATLGSSATSTCGLTLSAAAATGGAALSLSSTSASLTVPASVTVVANSASASFPVSTTSVSSDQTVTVTASLNGSSQSTPVSLVAPVSISTLQCDTSSLTANSSTSCTVTLVKAAPAAGLSVAVNSTAPALSIPSSVPVPAGASSASFTISTAAVSSDQTATITAALNGSSAKTSVSLVSPALISGLKCAATTLNANSSTTCTVTLSKAAANGGTTVSLASSVATLSVPASVTVPSGATSVAFAATAGSLSTTQTAVITAALSGSSQTVSLSLVIPTSVTALQCAAASLSPNTSTTCNVTLSQAATSGGVVVGITDNTRNLTVPTSVTVPANTLSVLFTITAGAFTSTETAVISASLGSSSASATISLAQATTATLLLLRGDVTELSGLSNGSTVSPAVAPSGLKGKLAINGNGAVQFAAAGGVYFQNCCSSTNNAYYKFTGTSIGNIFNVRQGRISFTVQSRSGFAQRQAVSASQRYSFATQDGTGDQFYFLTQVISDSLVFTYMLEGSAYSYYVPQGTEDRLFGAGVNLEVVLDWDGITVRLTLNGVVVKSSPYIRATAQWNGTSKFDLGAHEVQGVGSNVSDDLIRDFTVTTPNVTSTKTKPHFESTASQFTGSDQSAQVAASSRAPAVKFGGFSCVASSLAPGGSTLCRLTIAPGTAVDGAGLSLTSTLDALRLPAAMIVRKGASDIWLEVLADAEALPGTAVIAARSSVDVAETSLDIVQSEAPKLLVPTRKTAKMGSPIQFEVIATDERPYSISPATLPSGATFDSWTGTFRWVPTRENLGHRKITFEAINSLGLAITKTVELHVVDEVDSAGPEILTVGDIDSDQAFVIHAGSSTIASIPNARFNGQPARIGERLLIFATGIDCRQASAVQNVNIRFGNRYTPVNSIAPVDGSTGICQIAIQVPYAANEPKIPISLSVVDSNGRMRSSNTALVAVEK